AVETLKMDDRAAAAALFLCAVNPHLIYLLYHGFFPQIVGMGFFLCLSLRLPDHLENEEATWKETALQALFLAGIAMSYNELIPFVALLWAGYACWLVLSGR